MAFSEFETKRHEKRLRAYIEKNRPPPHVRSKLDLGFRIKDQSIEIFEIRPLWNNPDKKIEESVAKATYVKSQKIWRVYWQRADLKWHRYAPKPDVPSLEKFIELVEQDENACFFG